MAMVASLLSDAASKARRLSDAGTAMLSDVLGAATLDEAASKMGVSADDLSEWVKLCDSKALEASNAAKTKPKEYFEAMMTRQFGGEEIWPMMQALSTCSGKLSEELHIGDAKLGISPALPLVFMQHSTLEPVQCIGPLENLSLVTEACYWLDFANGAYGSENQKGFSDDDAESDEQKTARARESVKAGIGEKEGVEVKFAKLPETGVNTPGHFVAIDKTKQAVVLGIRGTTTASDAVTDAVGESVPVEEVPELEGHKAMLESARNVIQSTRSELEAALNANSDFTLMVTGHSLGAGTSILCSILLNAEPQYQGKLRCFAFAPPPVVSSFTASAVQAVEIHSFVNRADIVPRASLANIYHLAEECMAVDQMEDLDFKCRFMLASNADPMNDVNQKAILEQAKERVIKVVSEKQQARKQEHNKKFPPLFIAGNVYWIEWDGQPGGIQDSDKPVAAMEDQPLIHKVDAKSFQSLLLRGGANAWNDHLLGGDHGYKEGLARYREYLNANEPKMCDSCACQ